MLVVGCCLSFVVRWCSSYAVCWVLFDVVVVGWCCGLINVCWWLFVCGWLLYGVCCLLYIVRRALLCVVYWLVVVVRCA